MNQGKFYSNAYLWMIAVLGITLIGFIPSYFKKLSEIDSFHHFHGITAALWLIIVIVQPALYRFNKLWLHRIIGRISPLFALLVVIGGFLMMKVMMQNKGRYGTDDIEYYVGIFDAAMLIPFVLFYSLGFKFRKQVQLHARLMICTAIFPLVAPTSRILIRFGVSSWEGFMTGALIINEVIFIALIINDRLMGKFRWPYVLALFMTIGFHLSSYFIPQIPFWRSLMDKLL